DDWDRKIRLWRQHGMSVPDRVRHAAKEVVFESYPVLGYNYRMTDIQAAIGREQLKRLPELVASRRALADGYRELLGEVHGIELPVEPAWARSNWQSYCVRLQVSLDQRCVMQILLDRGIATRRGVHCAHREPAYSGANSWSAGASQHLHESEQAQDHSIILPLFPQMTKEDQQRVAHELGKACAEAGALAPSRPRPPASLPLPYVLPTDAPRPRPLLSIVTPAYNEAENLPHFYGRLCRALASAELEWEWVVVDDHSADSSFRRIEVLAQHDPR